jgi:hypothetical protein
MIEYLRSVRQNVLFLNEEPTNVAESLTFPTYISEITCSNSLP